jgi:hypothetical protein
MNRLTLTGIALICGIFVKPSVVLAIVSKRETTAPVLSENP